MDFVPIQCWRFDPPVYHVPQFGILSITDWKTTGGERPASMRRLPEFRWNAGSAESGLILTGGWFLRPTNP